MQYLILAREGHNRLYLSSAKALALEETRACLASLVPGGIEPSFVQVGGLDYISFSLQEPPDLPILEALARLSFCFALFLRQGELLKPVALPRWQAMPDSLNTILKYPGKTNEQFTRTVFNLARSLCRAEGRPLLFDPMCGCGTTLFEGAIHGVSAVGCEISSQWANKGASYFIKYLEQGRYKHKKTQENHKIAKITNIEYAPSKEQWDAGDTRFCRFMAGDVERACSLLGRGSVSLLVCDLPYGVQHGSAAAGGRSRDACAFLSTALPQWRRVLRPGAAVALSYNTFTTSRQRLLSLLEENGLLVDASLSSGQLAHRVDQAILRDVALAVAK